MSIASSRSRLTQFFQLRNDLGSFRLNLLILGKRLRRWFDNEHAIRAVEQDVLTRFQFRRNIMQADNRRNSERARHDCRMRRPAAKIGRDPKHVFPVHGRGV